MKLIFRAAYVAFVQVVIWVEMASQAFTRRKR